MPFDIEHTGGGGGGHSHRTATPAQCEAMHELIETYIDAHNLCSDCTTVRMGTGFLTYIAMDVATNGNTTPVDKDKLVKVVTDLHNELDQWVAFAAAAYETARRAGG